MKNNEKSAKIGKTFEAELPTGYAQVFHINAKDKKIGIIFNAVALVIMAVVVVLAAIPLFAFEVEFTESTSPMLLITYTVFFVSLIAYTVLHELVHGAAYKALTGEKLTFGLSWSCAFCGVPTVFTYRKTALIALAAPFLTFSVLLVPVAIALFFVHPLLYIACATLFALHLGGCAGDLYMMILLLFKFKNKKILMKDTGPEQFLYLPESEEQRDK